MVRLSKLGNVKLCRSCVVAYRTNDLCVPGETSLPGLDGKNNLTSLISTLQATLKANVQNSPKQSPKIHPGAANADPFASNVHQSTSSLQSFNSLQQSSNSLSSNSFQFASANSLSSIPQPPASLVPLTAPTTVQNHSRLPSLEQPSGTPDQHESKIAWKIRDPKKKRQKHITLGLTREEFANIQESLRHRPVKCK